MIAQDDNPAPHPPRRLRIDQFAPRRFSARAAEGASYSGRRLVIVAGLALVLLWGALYLIFRDWRVRYRARAAFGASQVAPAIDPLADVVPPGVPPGQWRQAVGDTHRVLVTVTAANVLTVAQMEALRADIATRVAQARAHPETARASLAHLWDDLAARAGPIVNNKERHPRPEILEK